MTVILYHVTRRSYLKSIMRHGLKCRYSQGRLAAVWLAVAGKREWALRHVGIERGLRLNQIVCLRLSVPKGSVRRVRRGIYVSRQDVPADAISEISGVAFMPIVKGVIR